MEKEEGKYVMTSTTPEKMKKFIDDYLQKKAKKSKEKKDASKDSTSQQLLQVP
jgi:hypothetical protein